MKRLLLLISIFVLLSSTTTFSQMNPWMRILNVENLFDMVIGPTGKIYVVSYTNNVWRSDDNGDNWVALGLPVSDLTAVDATSLGTVYVGSWGHGVYRSTDNGNTWALSGSPTLKVNHISSNSNGDVFVTTFGDSAIYRSTDNGITWIPKISGIQFYTIPIGAGTILADAFGNLFVSGIYKSADNGDNWVWISQGYSIGANALLVTSPGHIFAGGQDGVHRTTNDGLSWDEVNFGSPLQSVHSLAANSKGHIFRGMVDGGGVYYSDDEGDNWFDFNSGLTNMDVFDLAINSHGFLFAATYNGMFRTGSSTVNVNNDESALPHKISLSQNYPNPFNPTTTIKFQIPNSGFVTLEVFDLLGREVATLVNEVMMPGSYERVLNGNGLSSGFYLYKLNSGKVVQTKKMLLLK